MNDICGGACETISYSHRMFCYGYRNRFFHHTQISSYITTGDIQSQSTDSNSTLHSLLLSSITLEGRSFYNVAALGYLN